MRTLHAILATLIVAACGGTRAAPSVELRNQGGAPHTGRITVTVTDATGGQHEDAIRSTAEKHVAALAHAQDVDALVLAVTLTSVEFDPHTGIVCRVRFLVTTAGNDAIVASFEGAAQVAGPDQHTETTDCIEGLIGSLIDTHFAQLVDARAAP
jgi:hypothetical protein